MNLQLTDNYFKLFALEPKFALDLDRLESEYKAFQTRYHPDKSVHLGSEEKRLSLQFATLANEAYRTLKQPLERARYLLELDDVVQREETNTATSTAFLLEQMEWREELQEAISSGDTHRLLALETRVKTALDDLTQQVAKLLDFDRNYRTAAELVRRMRFLDKLANEIVDGLDTLEN